jgi:hypothetical protein
VLPETPGREGKSSELVPVQGSSDLVPIPPQLPALPEIPAMRDSPKLSQPLDDKVTRHVCHAVHLLEPLQSFVHHSIVDPRVRAICPSFGIDLVAVARHANLARTRRIHLRRVVMIFRIAIAAALALAVLQTIYSTSNKGSLDATPALVAAAVVVLIVIGVWAAVFWHVRTGRASAYQVLSGPRPRDQASPIAPTIEDRLEEVNRANVVVYARGQGDPFIGSGRKLFSWNTDPIDITRAATDNSGGKSPVPFDEIDLHNYLEREIPRLGFDALEVRNRLYVRGDCARTVGGLLPNLSAIPGSLVDGSWLASGLKHPSDQARTYLCMERIQMGGNLVTCMYVRARIEQKLLTLDGLIYLLPPLAQLWLPSRDLIAGGQIRAAWVALRTASRETVPVLRGRSQLVSRKDTFKENARKEVAAMRRELKDGLDHDYGAVVSLREALAAYDTTHYFEFSDVIDSTKRLLQRQMECIAQFLEDHGIDTSSLREQAARIYQNVNYTAGDSYTVGAVHGGTNIIGSHGAVNNSGSPADSAGQGPQRTPPGRAPSGSR